MNFLLTPFLPDPPSNEDLENQNLPSSENTEGNELESTSDGGGVDDGEDENEE